MAHAGAEVISKLLIAVEGVELTSTCCPDESKSCETCRLSKAKAIVSRRSDNEIPATGPFSRMSYDLIPMSPGYNNDQWISQFVDQDTGFHSIWMHRSKGEATKIVARMINIVETQYQRRIVFLRSDDERSLGLIFHDVLTEHGVQSERTAPYTSEQNGHVEVSGKIIIQKARCTRISANLPHNPWPETVAAAAYVLNRTPTSKTGKTPFEALYN